jgi:hypothetical protein
MEEIIPSKEYVQETLFEMEEEEEEPCIPEEEENSYEDEQVEGQLTIESLLEEKTRLLKEELEQEHQIELDGAFGNIIGQELAQQEVLEE